MKKYLVALAASSVLLSACSLQVNNTATPTPTSSPDTSMMQGSADLDSDVDAMSTATPAPLNSGQTGVMVGGAMMVPSKDIIDNATASQDHTMLVSAIKAAGLEQTLRGKGPYTVFAPTDDAIAKVPKATLDDLMKPANKAKLANLLKYHVVQGKYTSADLKDGQKLKTLQGESLTVNQKDGTWWVTDAKGGKAQITTADVMDSNGVTFVIDTVLMP